MFKCNRFHTTTKSTVGFKREKSGIEMNIRQGISEKTEAGKGVEERKNRKETGRWLFFTVASI